MNPQDLYIKTPLLHSKTLSDIISQNVYCKLENVQPANSFKIRGISQVCLTKLNEGYEGFVSFSGGNAGLALAHTCLILKKPCHIFTPSFVSPRILAKIKELGATVEMTDTGRECIDKTIDFAKRNPKFAMLHPYDDPELWKGYSTMVQEIKQDLPEGTRPSCLICSVGGGGMLTSILMGLENLGWQDVPVVAVETIGAHSLNKSLAAGKLVENYPMTSIAKTLGAPFVAQTLMDMIPRFRVISTTLRDDQAVNGCLKFADQHTFLVEPSCGVSLAVIYENILPKLLKENGLDVSTGPVVVIVCGGSDTSVEILMNHAKNLGVITGVN